MNNTLKSRRPITRLALFLLVMLVSACGGDKTAGIDQSGDPVAVDIEGVIDSFGSIIVNGIRFDTSNADFISSAEDGQIRISENQLRVGQFVRVKGFISGEDDQTGTATEVSYVPLATLDVSEAPVLLDNGFRLNNIDIITRDTTISSVDLSALDSSINTLEISGFIDDQGNLIATRIDSVVRASSFDRINSIRGSVAQINLASSQLVLTNGYTVQFDNTVVIDDRKQTELSASKLEDIEIGDTVNVFGTVQINVDDEGNFIASPLITAVRVIVLPTIDPSFFAPEGISPFTQVITGVPRAEIQLEENVLRGTLFFDALKVQIEVNEATIVDPRLIDDPSKFQNELVVLGRPVISKNASDTTVIQASEVRLSALPPLSVEGLVTNIESVDGRLLGLVTIVEAGSGKESSFVINLSTQFVGFDDPANANINGLRVGDEVSIFGLNLSLEGQVPSSSSNSQLTAIRILKR